MADFSHAFARRTRLRGGEELATILAGSPPGVLSMTGGFPNPATFPTDELDAIAARLLRDDAAVAMQYTPVAGLPGVREYLRRSRRGDAGPAARAGELMVTSGGMECIALLCPALVDPGDAVVVEAPSYLGALMAFAGAEAEVVPVDDGRRRPASSTRSRSGSRPGCARSSSTRSPSTRTRPGARSRSRAATRSSSSAGATAC